MGISFFCPQFPQTQNGQLIAPPLPFHQHLALIGAQGRQNTGYATLNHPGFDAFWHDDD
jgi:hypothetical protein